MNYRCRLLAVLILTAFGLYAIAASAGLQTVVALAAAARVASPAPVPGADPSRRQSALVDEPISEPIPKGRLQFTVYRTPDGEFACREATAAERKQMENLAAEGLGLQPINHPELKHRALESVVGSATGMTIVLRGTQQLQQNPAATAAFTRAAQNWEALIMSPITVYMDVDYGTTNFGQAWGANVLGSTSAPGASFSYQSVRTNLNAEATGEGNAAKQAVLNALPSGSVPTDIGSASSADLSAPQARAVGLLPAVAQSSDPAPRIGFNSNFTFDFDPSDGITPGQTDFDAVATHEIGHALGFLSDAGTGIPRPSVWDLFRFRSGTTDGSFTSASRVMTIGGSPDPFQFYFVPGNPQLGFSTGGPNGSTSNGGDGWQSSHWKHVSSCGGYIGIMDPAIPSGCRRTITSSDILALAHFGYNLTNNNAPPPPPPSPTPPANDNFADAQVLPGCNGTTTGSTFGATKEAGEPSHAPGDTNSLSPSHTIWFRWQAATSGGTVITTQGSDFDTILALYTGNSVNALTRVAFNDDVQPGSNLTSSVPFVANGGTTYWIAVDGWGGDTGDVQLNWLGCGGTPTPTPTPTPTSTPTPVPSPIPCAALTVNDNGDASDANPGDGVCATAGGACTLRAAIEETNARPICATVDINLSGVTGQINLSTALPSLNHNLNLNGPGSSQLVIQRSNAGTLPNFRVLTVGSGIAVSISNLTIANGNAGSGNGGGVLNSGTLTMTNCNVYGNTAAGVAGVYSDGPSLTLTNCNIGGTGAGQKNNGSGVGQGFSGGVIPTVGALVMNGGSVSSNTGGIGLSGPATLNGVSVISNTASGISVGGGPVTIINCLVANNTAQFSGGGINNHLGTLTVINSTISGNTSGSSGAGVYSSNANTTLVNTTVTNNRSQNTTGGGLSNSGTVLLKNTIVVGNFGGLGTTPDDIRDLLSPNSAANLIGTCINCGLTNGTNGNQLFVTNAGLAPLADNGGLAMTHALLPGSPAVNTGSNTLALDQNGQPLVTDQRGGSFARTVGPNVDIGAFEVQVFPPPSPTPTPTPTPTPAPSPGSLPTPVQVADGVLRLPLAANDLVYDPVTAKVYASTPASAGGLGNSLAPIDPLTGIISTPIFVGSEPRKLALSANNQYIYVGLDGVPAVRRFDLASQTPTLQFALGGGAFGAEDLAPMPGDPNAVAISLRNFAGVTHYEGVAIYDNGVQRPTTVPRMNNTGAIEFSSSPSLLYGYSTEISEFALRKMTVNSSGVSIASNALDLISGFFVDIKYENGKIFSSNGRVIDPQTNTILGTFPNISTLAFVPDSANGRAYFVEGTNSSVWLRIFDLNTFQLIGSLNIPGVIGSCSSLVRWGADGLAFRTSGNQIYFVRTSLVPAATMQFSAANYSVSEEAGTITITVTRTGSTSGAASVDYRATDADTFTVNCGARNGTAFARCDFATVVGAISFAAGETSKTFTIPILNDSYAEGNETFSVVLSNATGAALGVQSNATVTITDNETSDAANPVMQTNAVGVSFFVRQHYLDFLGREPEPTEPWSAVLNSCADQFNTNPNSPSTTCDRIFVSGSFFGSPEFKDKGFYVIGMYRVSFNRLPTYVEFSNDLASISGTTAAEVFAKRAAYTSSFVLRSEFTGIYAGKTNTEYVNHLMSGGQGQNYNLTSITTKDPQNPDTGGKVTLTTADLINQLTAGTLTRGQVLRAIAQSDEIVQNKEAVNAFVASQYYGYLRRAPDTTGFNNWVTYLQNNPNDFRTMVNGFVNSPEYRLRFGP